MIKVITMKRYEPGGAAMMNSSNGVLDGKLSLSKTELATLA